MNLLSRRSVLAIAAVVDVALHSGSTPVGAKTLAARHELPPRHLETLLQGLVHAKILKGVRGPKGGYELARERRRITVGEIVRTAMSLSTADPDDLGSNSVLLERVIDPAVRRAGETFLSQSRCDHGRTDVRHRREDACARRRESQRRFRHLTQLFARYIFCCRTQYVADLASARETGRDKIAPIRLEEPCGGVAFDWLRSSALIHLAALQLLLLPAGIDPLGFVAGRPHQRCERRFACARAAPGQVQGRPSRLQDGR